jgi:hypothetical protein
LSRRHRDAPAITRRADHIGVRYEYFVEGDLGEPWFTVKLGDRPHGHAGRPQVEHQVGQTSMSVRL